MRRWNRLLARTNCLRDMCAASIDPRCPRPRYSYREQLYKRVPEKRECFRVGKKSKFYLPVSISLSAAATSLSELDGSFERRIFIAAIRVGDSRLSISTSSVYVGVLLAVRTGRIVQGLELLVYPNVCTFTRRLGKGTNEIVATVE